MELKHAAEFPNDLEWLNSDPQNLAALKGQIVVLLFWNASSVYCHNALYELMQLQHKFSEHLAVIGIHIPKFTAELESQVITDTLRRLNIHLPIVCDRNCVLWQQYGIESWPTFVIVDGNGMCVEQISGDQQLKQIESKVSELLSAIQPSSRKILKEIPTKLKAKSLSVLNCPSGLLVHNNMLYISDTGNNRILECTLEGHLKRMFGNGLALNTDGQASEAAFNRPTGLCIAREFLYVADTGNHAIRRVRLLDGNVDTVLGNGTPGLAEEQIVDAYQSVHFNNPSSVSVQQDVLIVSDSGNNCLWMYNLVSRKFSLLVGSGELGLLDGVGAKASMAHPLAITGDKNYLYVIEGSSSSLRTVAVPEGRVNTLIGRGLFNFGSAGGSNQSATMQYPCALAIDNKNGVVWIADSYNRKLRILTMSNNTLSDSKIVANFSTPSAIAIDDDTVWIADSGANIIYRYYPATNYLARVSILTS
jgi:DNA-binding beta-propeller fold protein YncE/peroxiredoxin